MTQWQGFISGRPRTKGSLDPIVKKTGRGKVTFSQKDNPESVAWKREMIKALWTQFGVRSRAAVAALMPQYAGPVFVVATFALDPAWHGHSREDWPFPTAHCCGDLDKLARNLGDALEQSGLLVDDSQIMEWALSKEWAVGDPGVLSKEWAMSDPGVLWTVQTL